jgi:hypothetical protein
MWIAGWIALGAGAAAAALGLSWALIGGSSQPRAALRIAPTGIQLAGSFE